MVLVLISSTCTTQLQQTARIYNILCILAAPTGIQHLGVIARYVCTLHKRAGLTANDELTFNAEAVFVKVVVIVTERLCAGQVFVCNEEHELSVVLKETIVNVIREKYTIFVKGEHNAVDKVGAGQHHAIYEIICIIAPTVCKFVFGIVFSVNIFPNFDIYAVFGIADIACRYFTVKPAEISKSNFIFTLCA